ncbi:acyl-CoA dehydrogenase family protein [Pseudenhygromyxa sp. WMMC2535]|uniref:acyl-CoA dehydrogenase family protein n=1 Tax=Pseudenhygromyxa sp. WMMC2535 TaxID=2712867 RepID=UPI001554BF81|nr:acyl-CoA dehydrogenase family protein [Pseudenhygromyxa sp. WMMC2535]NVB41557.1 acyl-CoA dehydrogenase family protein [Pseudenhygromyxa sp. WMMC2535]
MEFELNETQEMIRNTARQFAERTLAPAAAELDREHRFPRAALAEAAELGLLGINVPAEYGGVEAGAVAYSLAVTELARACAATTVALCVSNMVAEVVTAFGNSDQRSEHVEKLCSGDYVVGGFALSEAGAGSDPGGMATRARKTDKGWVIDGSKLWITSGTDAGLFVVWARTSDAPGTKGVSCFLVPGDAPGLTAGKPEEKLGQRGSPTTALEFSGVEVGDEALLGELERGFPIAMMALDGGRVGIASLALGVGLAASEFANRYATERKQFGRPIASFQALQWYMADSATELSAARLLALRAAWLKEQGKPFTREASMAKLFASERAFTACNRALQMLGGYGYTADFPIERYLRDVRVTMIYEGTSEIQRLVIGRDVVRQFGS